MSTSFDDTVAVWGGAEQGTLHRQAGIKHNNATGRWVLPFRAVWSPAGDAVAVGAILWCFLLLKVGLRPCDGEGGNGGGGPVALESTLTTQPPHHGRHCHGAHVRVHLPPHVGNMHRAVDVFDPSTGTATAQLCEPELMTAIPSRNAFHPTRPALAAATASGRIHVYTCS